MKRLLLIAFLLPGCGVDNPEPRFGINLAALQFQYFRPDAGVAPSESILLDPNNPFADTGIADDVEAFAVSEVGSATATYYAFGTILATGGPIDPGVAQYFTGVGLQGIYDTSEFTDTTDPDDVRRLAIAAYQAMLDQFPSTLLDITGDGTSFTRLATPAYLAIEELGGVVRGNWELIRYLDEDGNVQEVAVQGGNAPIFPPEFDPAPVDEEEEEEG